MNKYDELLTLVEKLLIANDLFSFGGDGSRHSWAEFENGLGSDVGTHFQKAITELADFVNYKSVDEDSFYRELDESCTVEDEQDAFKKLIDGVAI